MDHAKIKFVGERLCDLPAELECLYVLGEAVPDEPWVLGIITAGLAHRDSVIREMALSVAACLGGGAVEELLARHREFEPLPWLIRYNDMIRADL